MSAKTIPITAAGFEKVFAKLATRRMSGGRLRSAKLSKDSADWLEIAQVALRRRKLGGILRHAIEALSTKYREVLFLHDVKNLNFADTAWVLNITVGAARYRLLRARMCVRDALTSRLLPKLSQKNSYPANSWMHGLYRKIGSGNCRNSFSLS